MRVSLFALGLACGSLAQVLMHLTTGELQGKPAIALGLYGASFLFLFIWVGRRGDPFFLPTIAALCGLGVAEIWRIDPSRGWQQVLWIVLGTVVYGVASRFRRWNALADLKYVWALLATILLLITLVFGAEVGGARAWLRIGRFSLQTSEIAKLLVVISLAGHLVGSKEFLASPGRRIGFIRVPSARHLGPLLLMWAVSMMMFVGQRSGRSYTAFRSLRSHALCSQRAVHLPHIRRAVGGSGWSRGIQDVQSRACPVFGLA